MGWRHFVKTLSTMNGCDIGCKSLHFRAFATRLSTLKLGDIHAAVPESAHPDVRARQRICSIPGEATDQEFGDSDDRGRISSTSSAGGRLNFDVDSGAGFLYQPLRGWRGGRVVEGAPLLREYTSKGYRGFESLPLRHHLKIP